MEKTTLTKKQQIKMLKDISKQLSYKLDNIKWTAFYTDYLKENVKEEKQHLKMKPDGVIHGLTAFEGGLLFAVQQIINYYVNVNEKPCLENYIFWRKTPFTAFSIVANYRKEISEALEKFDYNEVLKMDYCDLVK